VTSSMRSTDIIVEKEPSNPLGKPLIRSVLVVFQKPIGQETLPDIQEKPDIEKRFPHVAGAYSSIGTRIFQYIPHVNITIAWLDPKGHMPIPIQ
jgi:hypothetical protein